MKVSQIIAQAKDVTYSFEIIPPPRGRSIREVIDIVETLLPLDPKWFDVTSHASSASEQTRPDGSVRRRTFKKRPGTLGICGVIQNRFRIDTVAHILCLGFTREETEDALIELNYLGVENILALRGDHPNYDKKLDPTKTPNKFAIDLVRQVADLGRGKFLDHSAECCGLKFCVGVAGYPEKHFEADHHDADLERLKAKVDAGAEYVVSQMFYDNDHFFEFVNRCRKAGITVPILPGLKVFKKASQLKSIPRAFHIDLPPALVGEVTDAPEHAAEIGQRWAQRQVEGLLNNGFRNLHFYVMNDSAVVRDLLLKVNA